MVRATGSISLAWVALLLACGDGDGATSAPDNSSAGGVAGSPGSATGQPTGAPGTSASPVSTPGAGSQAPATQTPSAQPPSDATPSQDGSTPGQAMPPDTVPGGAGAAMPPDANPAGPGGAMPPNTDPGGPGGAGGMMPGDSTGPATDATPPPADNSSAMGTAGCGNASYPEAGAKTIDVGGMSRNYVVGLPAGYDPSRPYRVVFAWHGLGGNAAMTGRSWFGLQRFAQDSAIFIAGEAAPGNRGSWAVRSEQDTDYVQAIFDWASESYCIDSERVFSVGVSNGGMMANIVACQLGDLFRATAPIAGGGPRGYANMPCEGQVAVWITHGNRDNNVPFSYGEASRDYWVETNGCSTETTAVSEDCLEYQGCDDGYPVQFCEHDGGHTVPGFTGEAVWNFFAQF